MIEVPLLTPDLPGTGGLTRVAREDFHVEELPLYEPSGEGEHLYLTVEKAGRTTPEVARDGSFVFLRGLDQDALPISRSLDTQAMLLDGLRRLDEMELFRTRFPSSDVVVTNTGKAPAAELSPEAQKILSLVDGARTLAELATASALGEFEATKLAFKLLEQGYLRL